MKVTARLTSPLIAISLAVLPLPAAAAQPEAGAPAEPAADVAPAEGAEAPPAEGAEAPVDGAAPAEGVEGVESPEGENMEGTPTEPAPEGEGAVPADGSAEGEAGDPAGEAPAEGEVPTEASVSDLPEEEMLEPKLAGRPAKGLGMMITGGVLVGLGAAGIGASFALTNCPEPSNSIGCKNQHNRRLLVPIAGSVALVGTLLLVVGGIHAARYKKWQAKNKNKVAIAPTYLPGGGGVAYSMQF